MSEHGSHPPKDTLLHLLRRLGPSTTTQLAARLGTSKVAARQHLRNLEETGLIVAGNRRGQVGRPATVWSLTRRALQTVFPDRHALLAQDLLRAIRTCFGPEGVEKVLLEKLRLDFERDRALLGALGDLAWDEKVRELARIREEQGYMAEWCPDEEGRPEGVLVQNHCPVMGAAECDPHICDTEFRVLQKLLGDGVAIERAEHLIGGDHRCSYHVRPAVEV